MRWRFSRGWSPWFAWHPVELCGPDRGVHAWLEWVERLWVTNYDGEGPNCYLYRPIVDTVKEQRNG